MTVVIRENIYATFLHLIAKGSDLHLYQSMYVCNVYITQILAFLKTVVYI